MKKNYYWVIVAVIAIIVIGVLCFVYNNNNEYEYQNEKIQKEAEDAGEQLKKNIDNATKGDLDATDLLPGVEPVKIE